MDGQIGFMLAEFLRCSGGRDHELEVRHEKISCSQCHQAYRVEEGKIIFSEYPKDAFTREVIGPERYTRWRRNNLVFYEKELKDLPRDKILVDVGAGPTDFRKLLLSFKTYIGVDFYPYEYVSVVADITKNLPFRDQCCDIVFMSNTLEHVPYPKPLLEECFRILKPGGMVIGTVPFLLNVHQIPYDFNRYTNFMLEKMLREAGFIEVKVSGLGTPFDVYQTMQNSFFNLLMQGKNLRGVRKFFARLGRKSLFLLTLLFRRFFAQAAPSDVYTEGYSFKAIK